MRYTSPGYSAFVGLVVVIFVVLAGAFGYTYITNYDAEVASKQDKATIASVNTSPAVPSAPTINEPADLEAALSAVDAINIDAELAAELDSLDAITAEF